MEVREHRNLGLLKIEKLGVWNCNKAAGDNIVKLANGIECGRIVTRDIGGSDPERMSANGVMEYVQKAFKSSSINVSLLIHLQMFYF